MLLIVPESASRVPKASEIWLRLSPNILTLRERPSRREGNAGGCIGLSRALLVSLIRLARSYLSQVTVVEGQPP
jgi:hypothetical protein